MFEACDSVDLQSQASMIFRRCFLRVLQLEDALIPLEKHRQVKKNNLPTVALFLVLLQLTPTLS